MWKPVIRATSTFAFCVAILAGTPVFSVAATEDLEDLTLEELLNVNLSSMEALGFHHTHPAGEWMVGYRFVVMNMDGNLDGSREVSPDEVLQQFMVTPNRMTMEMHMFEVMYGLTDSVTLMAMFHYLQSSMDHQTRMGGFFTTDSAGMGDTSVSAMIALYKDQTHQIHVSGGVWLPTGSIDERDDTPMGPDQKLPYPMQLSSGTFDFAPGVAYVGQRERWAWGAQGGALLRTGENDNGYRRGNRYNVDGWAGFKFTEWVSVYARLGGLFWKNIQGADPDLNPRVAPTADPSLRGGNQLSFSFGTNFFQNSGALDGQRLTLDVGIPRQSMNGPQLGQDWQVSLEWQKTF